MWRSSCDGADGRRGDAEQRQGGHAGARSVDLWGGGEASSLSRRSQAPAGETASGHAQHKESSRRLRGWRKAVAAEGDRACTAGFDPFAPVGGRGGGLRAGAAFPRARSSQEGAARGPALGALAARFGGSGEGGQLL